MIIMNNQKQNNRSGNGGRRLLAWLCALMMLVSSSGITAFADPGQDIYSDPVSVPKDAEETSGPAEEDPQVADPSGDAIDNPEETGEEAQEGAAEESTEETPAETTGENPEEASEENPEGTAEGQEDAGVQEEEPAEEPIPEIVYSAGSLSAETASCTIRIDYSSDACIPEDAVITVREAEGMEIYAALKSAAKVIRNEEHEENAIWGRKIADDGNKFYVVSILDAEGNEITPNAVVTLSCQNGESPEGVTYFLTGEEPRIIEAETGAVSIPDYNMAPFGYATIEQEQIGIITQEYNGRDYQVTATYGPEAGFPADTELKVREIMPGTDEYVLYSGMTDEALNEEWSEITLERYFDITFISKGEEIEPQADIDVQIIFKDVIELTEEHDVQAVHIENNEASVIETATDSNENAIYNDEAIDTISFTSDSFSVYGVVQRKKITQKVLAADGLTYQIEVTYGPEAEIPEGATLRVVEIPEGSDLWEAYRKQTAAALDADDVRMPGLFDITIIDAEGNEIEPKAPISVSITLVNAEEGNDELHVVHFTQDMPEEMVTAAAEEKADEQTKVQPLAEEEKIESEKINANVDGQTVTFETDGFSVYAFAYAVITYVKTASGETYEITLSYGKEADIPEGAQLKVEEIPEGSDMWEAYRKQTAAALGVDNVRLPGLYDITILDAEGNEVEPKAPVSVSVTLANAKEGNPDLHVVHFTEEIPEELVAAAAEEKANIEDPENEQTEAQPLAEEDKIESEKLDINVEGQTVTFRTDSFSVYAFAYTIITYFKTASGETWEITLTYEDDAQIPEGAQLVVREIDRDSQNYDALSEALLTALNKQGEEYSTTTPALFDISIVVDGEKIEPAPNSTVKVEAKLVRGSLGSIYGEDAPVQINDTPLTEENSSVDAHIYVVHAKDDGDTEIVETEDDLTITEVTSSFTTDSFSDWLVYLDEELEEITVSVDDTITLRPYSSWIWKGTDEIAPYNENSVKWYFENNPEWTKGEAITTRVQQGYWSQNGWVDQSYDKTIGYVYTYNDYLSVTPGATVQYLVYEKTDDQLEETYTVAYGYANGPGSYYVTTTTGKTIKVNVTDQYLVDLPPVITGSANISVNLFNYDNTEGHILDVEDNKANNDSLKNQSVNSGHQLYFLGWGGGNKEGINYYSQSKPNQGIVAPTLGSDGYPYLAGDGGESLAYLFNTSANNEAVKGYANVQGLFRQDSKGYYYYNSNSNYAWFDEAQNRFVLYSHTFSQNTQGTHEQTGSTVNAKPIGFFPFHRYDAPVKDALHPDGGMNFNSLLDHHFGMSMQVDFTLPESRMLNGEDHIIYEFSGDDDLWVYIDDKLVLDIGGIHQPVRGYIDFTDQKVYVYGVNPVNGVYQPISFNDLGINIPTNQKQTLRMFYLERGGCDSNLSVKFNLPLTVGDLDFTKVADGLENKPLKGAVFGLYSDEDCAHLIATATSSDEEDHYGRVSFKDIPLGTTGVYYLKEITPPYGYKLDEENEEVFKVQLKDNSISDNQSIIYRKGQNDSEWVELNPRMISNKPDLTSLKVEKDWIGDNSSLSDEAKVNVVIKRYKIVPEEEGQNPEEAKGTLVIGQILSDFGAGENPDCFKVEYKIKNEAGDVVREGIYNGTQGATIKNLDSGVYSIEATCSSTNPEYYAGNKQQNRTGIVVEGPHSTTVTFSNTLTKVKYYQVSVFSKDSQNIYGSGSGSYREGTKLRLTWKYNPAHRYGPWFMNGCEYNISDGWKSFDTPWTYDETGRSWSYEFVLKNDTTIRLQNNKNDYEWTTSYDWFIPPTLEVISTPEDYTPQQSTPNGRGLRANASAGNAAPNPDAPEGHTIITEFDDPGWPMTVTLPDNGSWTTIVENLEKVDIDGNIYVYYIDSVTETDMPNGTSVTIDLNGDGTKQVVLGNQEEAGTLSLTNTLLGDLTITKVLSPDTNATGTFRFGVYSGETPNAQNLVRSAEIDLAESAYVTVEDLPFGTYYVYELDNNNNPITDNSRHYINTGVYTVSSTGSPARVTDTPGNVTITNTNIPTTTEISGTKTWVDERTHDNSNEITLILQRKRTDADESAWTPYNGGSFSWDGNTYTYNELPKYENNLDPTSEYQYRVLEQSVNVTEDIDGQTITVNYQSEGITDFTNTELTNIEATKTWLYGTTDINDTITNVSVTFTLQQRLKDTEEWTDVPEIENKLENPKTMSVATPANPDAWHVAWEELPKYKLVETTPVEIEYQVVETEVILYNRNITGETNPISTEVEDGITNITNSIPTTDCSVEKTWGETQEPPEGSVIEITLTAKVDNEDLSEDALMQLTGLTSLKITMNGGKEDGNDTEEPWKYTWKDLPKYDSNGNEVSYSAEETSYVIGKTDYTDSLPGNIEPDDDSNTIIITNTVPTTSINVKKEWEGGTPQPVTLKLVRYKKGNGTTSQTTDGKATVILYIKDSNERDLDSNVGTKLTVPKNSDVYLTCSGFKLNEYNIFYPSCELYYWDTSEDYTELQKIWKKVSDIGVCPLDNQIVHIGEYDEYCILIKISKDEKQYDCGISTTPRNSSVKRSVRFRADTGVPSAGTSNTVIPSDYERDDSTSDIIISLPEDSQWQKTIEDLPVYDTNGNVYYYELVEESVPYGYRVDYSKNNPICATDMSSEVTLQATNTQLKGQLEITKRILKNGVADPGATGTFYYGVYSEAYDPNANPAQTPIRTGSIAVTENGMNTATENNLPYGPYYVYELDREDGSPIENGFNTIGSTEYIVSGSGTSVTVGSTPGTVTLNNTPTGSLKVIKALLNDSATAGKTFNFEVTLTNSDNSNFTGTIKLSYNDEEASQVSVTNGKLNIAITGAGYAVISGLPVGTSYTVEETGFTGLDDAEDPETNWVQWGDTYYSDEEKTIAADKLDEVTITNARLGSLEITKNILKNGVADLDATGTFYYGVYSEGYDPNADPAQTPVSTGAITVNGNGTNTATVDNLPYGPYYVYELDREDGSPIKDGFNTIGSTEYIVSGSGASATVGSTPGTVTLENNRQTIDIEVDKKWKNGPNDITESIENASITVKLLANGDKVEADAYGTTVINPVTLTGEPDSNSHPIWSTAWTNLPKYDSTGKEIEYKVVETSAQIETNKADSVELISGDGIEATPDANVENLFHLENPLPTKEITIRKTWDSTTTWPDSHLEVGMTLMADDAAPETLPTYTPAEGENPVAQTALIWLTEGTAQTGYTWHNLPVYTDKGKKITYTVEETGMMYRPDNGEPIEISGWADAFITEDPIESTDKPGVFTIKNTPRTTEIQVTKVWTLNHADRNDKQKITYTLYKDGTADAINLNGYTIAANHGTATANEIHYTNGSGWQTVTIPGLPMYELSIDATVNPATVAYSKVEYYVTEDRGEGMTYTTITYSAGAGNESGEAADAKTNDGLITITNRDTDLTLKVLKIDTTNNKKLKGAEFQLQKQMENDQYAAYTKAQFDDSPYNTEAEATLTIIEADSGITFRMLTDGNYKLVETKAPDGYLMAQNPELAFTVTDGVITPDIMANGFVVDYEPVDTDNATPTVTIGNTPGVALPSTGGSGTLIYTTGGLALVLIAGVLLISRKRKKI